MNGPAKHTLLAIVIRWTARTTGVLLVLTVALFTVAEGAPNVFRQPAAVQLEFLAMVLMLLGFFLGWHWEGFGGIVAVAGFVFFFCVELLANGKPPGGAIPFFAIPGVLFLISYGLRRRLRHSAEA